MGARAGFGMIVALVFMRPLVVVFLESPVRRSLRPLSRRAARRPVVVLRAVHLRSPAFLSRCDGARCERRWVRAFYIGFAPWAPFWGHCRLVHRLADAGLDPSGLTF